MQNKITLLVPPDWSDYQLLDTGNGKRLEKFGPYLLVRPDPQIIWQPNLPASEWQKADAIFEKDCNGKERWVVKTKIPNKWLMKFKDIAFFAKLSPFKHTGVFPEQAAHWEWINQKITESKKPVSVLNLFAYTGISSIVAAKAGGKVTHVDASFPTVGWAKENQQASNLAVDSIRWILDDALKFTAREIKRGIKYDAIIMDPPIFGHGPNGEKWDFNKDFPLLLKNCLQILSDKPLFIIVNAYAISSSSLMLGNMLEEAKKIKGGGIDVGELTLEEKNSGRILSTGIFGRWSN